MAEKVYEMDEDYNKAAAQLVELIEARDMLAESIKKTPFILRGQKQLLLREVNQKIEKCEAVLAAEYEAHQKACRAQEHYEKTMDELHDAFDASFIYLKHCHPDRFENFKDSLYSDWTEEEIIEFEDRIAILEATRLEEFIGKKDETNKNESVSRS